MPTFPDCVCCGAAGCGSCPGDQCRDCDLYCSSMSHCDRERSAPPSPPPATELCPRCGGGAWLGVGPMCGACIAAAAEQPAKPSPAWVWTDYGTGARGYLGDADARAAGKGFHVTITDHGPKMIVALYEPLGDGCFHELRTPLPAWSLSQCKRWVEQWVASQADAAVAAFEAAEEGR